MMRARWILLLLLIFVVNGYCSAINNLPDNTVSEIKNTEKTTITEIESISKTSHALLFLNSTLYGNVSRGAIYVLLFIFLAGLMCYSLIHFIKHQNRRHTEETYRFFINTVYDIRNMLSLINAPIEELNKEDHLSEKGRFFIKLATDQLSQLSFTTDQLLELQSLDKGEEVLSPHMVDIVEMVKRRKSMFETVGSKNITIRFTSNKEAFITGIDEIKIEKVIDSLLSNAIKESPDNGLVEILLTCNNKNWSIEIKYGTSSSGKTSVISSGIEMLLVKNYVRLHKGRIKQIGKVNKKPSYKIIIPYMEVPEKVTSVTEQPMITPKPEPIVSDNNDQQNRSERKKHILVAEDNKDLQLFLQLTLSEQYRISSAPDGVKAWKMIQKEMPDIVISDVMMPRMDGFELCRLLKSTFETSHIPIILLTGLYDKEKQLEGLELGADDYIVKPFDMHILRHRINTLVRNRMIVREKAVKLIKKDDHAQITLSNQLNDNFVKKALEVVHNNIENSHFGKEEFATEMNVSTSLLYKKMKNLTGQSPADFIRTIRLNHALKLLQSQEHSITEVSELCGFSSISYFSTAFKKHFGKPPMSIHA